MGEVGEWGHWLPIDASNSNRASMNFFDAGVETNTCGICSTEVVNRGVLDCCAHWFCFACIDDWATVTNLCPLCKARFRFITCLPVGYGNPNDPDNIGAGFAKRVDGSADDDSNFPFSFPSYFIDEEAVVCLEGNACRVRAGLPSLEVEGALAADTSVACDLCDCWYHAGCVDFDPEQSSFYCPRCIASQEKPRNSWHTTVESGIRISSEARASSLIGLLPPAEKELSYGGGTVLGSTSVAIAVAEKGESAVSLSMRRIPVQPSAPQHSAPFSTLREKSKEVMWSPIREPVKASQSYGPSIISPIHEPLNITSQDYELWSPTPGPVNQDYNDEELWSPTPESERASVSIFKEQPIIVPVVAGNNSVVPSDSIVHDKMVPEVSTSISAPGPHRQPSAASEGSDISSVGVESRAHVAPKTKPFKKPEGLPSPVGAMKKDEKVLIDGDIPHATTAVEQLKKGRRKALQEDERRIDSKDLPEPPRKVARRSTKKSDALEGRNLAVGKDSSNKSLAEENVGDKPDDRQSKGQSSIVAVKDTSKEVPIEEAATDKMVDDGHEDYVNQAEKEESPTGDVKSHVDVMDIVSDPRNRLVRETGERSCNHKGVRTRIIMHRETDANDTVGSGLVDRIRQQMRATAGYIGGGEDLSKVEVSDDRFLAAFKAALLSSREKSKETKSTASRQATPLWLAKVLNRKGQGKGSRDSLTRKLYAGGTGRWDRDWDIAFWKERSGHLRKAQKEAEDEVKSLGMMIGKHARGDDTQPEEEDSIFSRIYVADSSLFPRNDDVQLLSDKGKNPGEGGGKKATKAPQLSLVKGSLQRNVANNSFKSQGGRITSTPTSNLAEMSSGTGAPSKDGTIQGKGITVGANVKVNTGLGGKLSSSPKFSTKPGSVQPQVSTESVTPPEGDVKKDKRQWALEVLARKTGSSSNGSSHTQPGPAKTMGSSDNREGQFSLLLQLPVEMRPLLQHNRHSKVPTAVRQVQLNRIVEQELRRVEVAVVGYSPECEEAVNLAKAREENLYKKSNSRGVYVNLCVRSLAQSDAAAKVKQQETEVDHSDAIQKALEATGLVGSPPASPSSHRQDDPSLASTSIDAKLVPSKDSGDELQDSHEEKWVDNVLELGNLDIYGDLEFNLGNFLEDPMLSESLLSSNPEAPTSIQDSTSGIKKMAVVLASASNSAAEPAKCLSVIPSEATSQSKEMTQDNGTKVHPVPTPEVSVQARPQMEEDDDLCGGLEGKKLTDVPIDTVMVAMPNNRSAHAVSLGMPASKENPHVSPLIQDLKMSTSRTSEGLERNGQNLSDVQISQSPSLPPVIQNMDDWMNSGKFADLDRRIENIRQSTSPSGNREMDVPWSANRTSIELASQNDLLTPQQSVQKQVEIYVNQHLKPLYRSGVINSDQFRYAVSKTAAKVMEHHENATSADFLIVEGSKVKKLADQYLQNYTKRKVKGSI